MNGADKRPVLITGGTGMQGRPTVAHALELGLPVHVLVRQPDSEEAVKLAQKGATLVQGSLDDIGSLKRAMSGVRSVFSLLGADPAYAMTHFDNLLAAAVESGVEQFVQSTVSSTGLHESFPGWSEGQWAGWYWENKQEQEQRVMAAGFRYWTMVRPALLMDNLLPYRADAMMHPQLTSKGLIVAAHRIDTPIAYVSSETVGAAGAHALADPDRYNKVVMELADDMISTAEVADILSEVTGRKVTARQEDYKTLVDSGIFEPLVSAQAWLDEVGYAARPAMLADYGLTPLPFRQWAQRHAAEFKIGSQQPA